MMKTHTKLLSILIALVMSCFLLSACASDENADKSVSVDPIAGEQEQETGSAVTWRIQQTVDEFGDITEDSNDIIVGTFSGEFSNTATSGSDLSVVVSFGKKETFNHYVACFDLMEYNTTKAVHFSSDSKLFKMKINDEIITMDLTGTEPNGALFLSSEKYEWEADLLFKELYNGNDVRCIINIGSSVYNFTLHSDNFASLCNEYGFSEGRTELTVAEAINMLLEDTGEYSEVAMSCIKNNIDKYELLGSADIKELLDGYFLEIGPGYSYVGNNAYYAWEICEISPTEHVFTLIAQYNVSFNSSNRIYTKKTEIQASETTFENDLIVKTYADNASFSYQCRKIGEDIYMLCILSEGEYKPSSLLLKINGNNLDEDVKYIQSNKLSKIAF